MSLLLLLRSPSEIFEGRPGVAVLVLNEGIRDAFVEIPGDVGVLTDSQSVKTMIVTEDGVLTEAADKLHAVAAVESIQNPKEALDLSPTAREAEVLVGPNDLEEQ